MAGVLPVRSLIYLVFLMIAATLGWLALTDWEVLVDARGHLTTRGEPVEVSTTQMARVAALMVTVGQAVAPGDGLLRCDTFEDDAEVTRLSGEIDVLVVKADHGRQRADRLEIERRSAWEAVDLSRQDEALARRAYERANELNRERLVADDAREQSCRELLAVEAKTLQLRREAERLEAERDEQQNSAAEVDRERGVLESQRTRAQERIERGLLRSPVQGVVTSVLPRHAGAVIRPGEPAVVILPSDRPLMARVEIPNAAIRRIHEGEAVQVDIDAFPRSEYGAWEGRLEHLGPDANGHGMYEAWISLAPRPVGDARRGIVLRPGLAVTARIVSESRSLLAELLSPFRKP